MMFKDADPPVRGGVEATLARMARGARQAGAEVTVITSASGSTRDRVDTVDGYRVIRCGEIARMASTPICPTMPFRLASVPSDIVHLHYPSPPGEISTLLAGHGRRVVITYHCDVVRQVRLMRLYRPFADAILDRAQVLMPTSPQYIELSGFLRPRRARCRVLPLGVDLEPFENLETRAGAAARLRERYGTPLVMFVGRFRHYKGLDVLVRAMASVPARLVLLGGGPEAPALRALVGELGLGDRVAFVSDPDSESLLDHFAAADICVLPSVKTAEALGLALIEGLAAGRALVSTELGTGTSYVNVHEETGLVVPPNDPMALAGALTRLALDPALRARFGAAGRVRARRLFSTEAMVRSLIEVYEGVAGRRIDA
jgi:glycosyltransferase involved in cell wall biosynthesis